MNGASNSKTVAERLADEIDRFDPFEALRLLREQAENSDEPLAVRSSLTNRFTPTPLRGGQGQAVVETVFLGFTGLLGALPPFYTETVLREQKRRNHALRDFLDSFLVRITELFVRTFEKYRLPSLISRSGSEGGAAFTTALFAIIGLASPLLRGRLLTSASELLPYAGLLVSGVRSAVGLEILLTHQLGLPVRIEPLQPRWLDIEPQEQTRLHQQGGFRQLHVDAIIGTRTLDVTSKFRIVIGPVDHETFQWLTPGELPMNRLTELGRFYIDQGLDFDIQVILCKDEVPECQLGARPLRLGWNSWLRQLPATRDADQPIFDPS